MDQRKKAFTLIELIIVVVIIGILALVAIPRYFANVGKAQKSQVYATLDAIRQADLAYYATYGVWPSNSFPIIVAIDGDTIFNLSEPSTVTWDYRLGSAWESCSSRSGHGRISVAYKQPGDSCYYALCSADGYAYGSCTP
ncbi:MAG: prepilin-type N-terminal cleavage/methylation domain-containing protein [Candidatus Omnitrophica bacterium]|nr:prepilin-type N-terminal cleavage/methylation domain-containing protein [Candidatus Omnitrophota bacterium]